MFLLELLKSNEGNSLHSREDFKAVSVQLGSKSFFFGDEPSLLDVTVFSFVNCFVTLPDDSTSELKMYLEKELPNLVEHYQRIKEKYWPDFEDCKAK